VGIVCNVIVIGKIVDKDEVDEVVVVDIIVVDIIVVVLLLAVVVGKVETEMELKVETEMELKVETEMELMLLVTSVMLFRSAVPAGGAEQLTMEASSSEVASCWMMTEAYFKQGGLSVFVGCEALKYRKK
jgi:hypothetical protein